MQPQSCPSAGEQPLPPGSLQHPAGQRCCKRDPAPTRGAGEAALLSPAGRFATSLNIHVNCKVGASLWT